MQIEAPQDQLQRQQRLIRELEEQIEILTSMNKQLVEKHATAQLQRQHYKNLVTKDPLFMILNATQEIPKRNKINFDYEDVKNRMVMYRTKAGSLEGKVHELQKTLIHKQNRIRQTERKLLHMEEIERDSRREYTLLRQQNRILIENHKQLVDTLQNYESKWKIFENQIHQTKKKIIQTNQEHREQLRKYNGQVQQLKSVWFRTWELADNQDDQKKGSESARIQELNEKFKKQSQIMEELGRELDARNDHIAQILRSQNQEGTESNIIHSDQHSMREMMHSSKLREQRYTDLLQKYRQVQNSLKESLKQKKQLQKQYILLKQEVDESRSSTQSNKAIKDELQRTKQERDSIAQDIKKMIQTMDALLAENDVFQNFMRQQYGSKVYQDKIVEEVKKYQMRKSERDAMNVWANTAELIEMNRKLRDKLTKRR